jgi:hypothetical protein
MNDQWSKQEKAIARRAFEAAYRRECAAVLDEVRRRAAKGSGSDVLWEIQVYLDERLKEIAAKYDYRYQVLLSVFARLMYEGWLFREDLAGISEDKLQEICSLTEFYSRL